MDTGAVFFLLGAKGHGFKTAFLIRDTIQGENQDKTPWLLYLIHDRSQSAPGINTAVLF